LSIERTNIINPAISEKCKKNPPVKNANRVKKP